MTRQFQAETTSPPSLLKSFTFLGGELEREALPTVEEKENVLEESIFSLAQAKAGDRLCIVGFKGDACTMQHLNHLGFYPGTTVRVISRSISGSVIVAVAGRRLGLGRHMAQQVLVCQG